MAPDPGPPRRRVDLTLLPWWAQYGIALAIVAVVVALVFALGGKPAPVAPWQLVAGGAAFVVAMLLLGAARRPR